MSKWIRKGDKVVVLAGNEKGQVASVLQKKEDRVVLEGLNIRKKHVKAQQRMQQGIVQMETPMHISNVSLCNEDGKAVKVKVKQTAEGERQLVYMDKGNEVIFRNVKKR